jgi:hypothetical protein
MASRADAEQAQVPEHVLDHPEFAVLDQFLLWLAVPDGEQQVLVDRQDERLGGDPAEGGGQVTAGVPGHVAALPFPGLGEQVVRIQHGEIQLQEAVDELLPGLELQGAPNFLLPELGGEPDHGPDVRLALQAASTSVCRSAGAAAVPGPARHRRSVPGGTSTLMGNARSRRR